MQPAAQAPYTKWPNGEPPEHHQWVETELTADKEIRPTPDEQGNWVDFRLLECRNCRLAITIYAETNSRQYNPTPTARCVRVHLSREAYDEAQANKGQIPNPKFHGVCGFAYRWNTIGDLYPQLMIPKIEYKQEVGSLLPAYRRVNCPDCLYLATQLPEQKTTQDTRED